MPAFDNPCPHENVRRADPNTSHHQGPYDSLIQDLFWGCTYNPSTDRHTQNLAAPLRKDSFQLWQRSWSVIRFRADAPGVWQFHCHMEQHIPLGMVMAINVLPSKQLPVPESVPTEGTCSVWSDAAANTTDIAALAAENRALRQRVAALEKQVMAGDTLFLLCRTCRIQVQKLFI